jgi:hypothetical protein
MGFSPPIVLEIGDIALFSRGIGGKGARAGLFKRLRTFYFKVKKGAPEGAPF